MARPKLPLHLSPAQHGELRRLVQAPNTPQKLVRRARIALLAAHGLDNKQIAAELHTSHVTVGQWRQRVLDAGLAGLQEAPRPGRPRTLPSHKVQVVLNEVVRPPKGTTHAVLDTPAGLHGKRLDEVMKLADRILVPLQPSIFDIRATHEFVRLLRAHRRSDKVQLALVGMRVREGTIAADQLRSFLGQLDVPVLGYLRDTQNYVHLAARGLTLWDVASARVERDLEQWQPIIRWVDSPDLTPAKG